MTGILTATGSLKLKYFRTKYRKIGRTQAAKTGAAHRPIFFSIDLSRSPNSAILSLQLFNKNNLIKNRLVDIKRKNISDKVMPANTQPVIEPRPPFSVSLYIAPKPRSAAAKKANQNTRVLIIDLSRPINLFH